MSNFLGLHPQTPDAYCAGGSAIRQKFKGVGAEEWGELILNGQFKNRSLYSGALTLDFRPGLNASSVVRIYFSSSNYKIH